VSFFNCLFYFTWCRGDWDVQVDEVDTLPMLTDFLLNEFALKVE
jgi:hypothetical protein